MEDILGDKDMQIKEAIEVTIQRKADLMRNEIVLDTFDTYRLLGWTDQLEEDYYWVILRKKLGKFSISLYSCVCGFIRLKGNIPDEEYDNINNVWNINDGTIEYGLELVKSQNIVLK